MNYLSEYMSLTERVNQLKQKPAVQMYIEASNKIGHEPRGNNGGCYGCGVRDENFYREVALTNQTFKESQVDIPKLAREMNSNHGSQLTVDDEGNLVFSRCVMTYHLFEQAGRQLETEESAK